MLPIADGLTLAIEKALNPLDGLNSFTVVGSDVAAAAVLPDAPAFSAVSSWQQ